MVKCYSPFCDVEFEPVTIGGKPKRFHDDPCRNKFYNKLRCGLVMLARERPELEKEAMDRVAD